jgi:hypothetical protein
MKLEWNVCLGKGSEMTDKQIGFYRVLWSAARKALVAGGMKPAEAEARRHELHVECLGKDKSSLDLTRDDFTKLRRKFEAIAKGEDLNTQLAVDGAAEEAARASIRRTLLALELPEGYAVGIARRMHGGGLSADGRAARPDLALEDMDADELHDVFVELKVKCRARWGTTPALRVEIERVMRVNEIAWEAAREAVESVMGGGWLRPLAGMRYDDLVIVLGALRPLAAEVPF